MRLVLCSECQRHVRDDANACPFCGREIAVTKASPERIVRLGRAAIMAFGVAATAVSVDACKNTDSIVQPYGAPPTPTPDPTTAPPPDAAPAPSETAIAMPYGAPPQAIPDAGAPKDAGALKDAAMPKNAGAKKDASTAVAPPPPPPPDWRNMNKPYGAPPIPEDYV